LTLVAAAARLGCAAALALCFGGCAAPGIGGDDSEPMAVVVLFDNSLSADDSEIATLYEGSFGTIVDTAADGRGGYLAAYLIDANPLVSANQVTATLKRQGGNETDVQYRARTAPVVRYAKANVKRLISKEPEGPGTGILDALDVAQRFFDNHPESEEKYLVVLSDMIEESDRLDASKIQTPEARAAAIKADQDAGRLPQLPGVVIYVAGAGLTTLSGQTGERVRAWREFWIAYFGAAGAELSSARYAPRLSRFPPPG
jgi:hypothetical protein